MLGLIEPTKSGEAGIRRQALSSTLSSSGRLPVWADRRERIPRTSRREPVAQPFLLLSAPPFQLCLSFSCTCISSLFFSIHQSDRPSFLGEGRSVSCVVFINSVLQVCGNTQTQCCRAVLCFSRELKSKYMILVSGKTCLQKKFFDSFRFVSPTMKIWPYGTSSCASL